MYTYILVYEKREININFVSALLAFCKITDVIESRTFYFKSYS